MAELILQYVLFMVLALLVVPGLGGALLCAAFRITKVSDLPFRQCWKTYLSGCCFAYAVLMAVQLCRQNDPAEPAFQIGIFLAVTVLTVFVLLRKQSRRALVVGTNAVLVIDALILGVSFVFFQAMQSEPPAPRQAPPAGVGAVSLR